MPQKPPDGSPPPDDGALPPAALAELTERAFGAYVHVPYCAARCGYCDFNTYTAADLGGALISSVGLTTFVDIATKEIRLARAVLGDTDLPISTVFVGGGTPTLLSADDLARLLRALDTEFGLATDAEVTTEANPESVDPAQLEQLRAAGFTRVSFGMQSDRPHVLAALDRRHTPGRVSEVMRWARKAGFEQVSLDLIYGAPGESESDWAASLRAAVQLGPDHVSAYALTVEEGTKLSRRVRRGELLEPDDDLLADRYLLADEILTAAGLTNYEVSNWSRGSATRCRHNLGYWRGDHWWGFGPGAHSHVGGVRWWNVRHPAEYAARLAAQRSPAAAREELDASTRRVERVMLGVRLAEGLGVAELDEAGLAACADLARSGLVEPGALESGRVRLTRRGRLLTDTVVRALLPD
ncbi:coproporphyrinogen III oxidase, anaerobic [Frankia torreyi]|uniref:Heme chaperone HemW n=1 Tax=Frankia torreyi TaxID=1856 RepID=A0A0D8BN11_9ACTN|nr:MULTISPECIES: radical SAM family heme chaperone HemW [Frankia]KJE25588.1 coproporphyrinogen III oxidase, anaerobic [Frankia torreyi]KQC36368.1 coproporphyrinogen III oxidase [Frankia sp. ACN1ag]KQM06233.1 coproporphyrinogen III oxidase, anaerobic [Frankia sp. CpI1-P]